MSIHAISQSHVFIPDKFGNLDITFDGSDFFVIEGKSKSFKVHKFDLSKELREMSAHQLQKCLEFSYLALNKVGNDYSLKLNHRLLGGGPITGWAAYCLTKTFCYGTALAAGTAAAVATGGAVAPVAAAAMTVIGAGATTGAVAVSAAIGTSAAAAAVATELTVGTLATAGGAAGAIVMVESAALGVGAFFTAIPFLP